MTHRLNLKLDDETWNQLQDIRRRQRKIPSNKQVIQEAVQQSTNMGEDYFICPKCKTITKESDFDYKENNLFRALKESNLCETCNRGDK